MTEEDAKKKWCPMINFQIGPNTSTWLQKAYNNRGQDYEPASCLCIASDCMMWRQTEPAVFRENGGDGPFIEKKTGYCGLGEKV